MKRHFKFWGAVYIIGLMWLISSIIHWWMQVRIAGDTWYVFTASTFENLQSEFMQLVFQSVVILALGHLWFKADKHDIEQIEKDLKEIKEHLKGQ